MHRFYVDLLDSHGRTELSKEDSYHASKVLRLSAGDVVELICQGKRYLGELLPDGGAQIKESLPSTEPRLQITLFQGLPKADKMEMIVQKAVELGVARVVPVMMKRCVVRLAPQDGEKKQARWQKIAREAGKQSGRCLIPEISAPIPFHQLAAFSSSLDASIVPWEEARSMGPRAFAQANPSLSSLGILIGPEGGIEPEEIAQLEGVFQPLTLGPRILRTETAGLAVSAAMMALYGEME